MKKLKLLSVALFVCFHSFIASAQWVQDANGDLSTSKDVFIDGEVRITAAWAPLYLKTGIESFLDMNILQNGTVGYMGNNRANFVWGMWGGVNGGGQRPAFRIGKVVGTEWNHIGFLSTAIGENVGAEGNYSLSVGYGSRANANYSVALGGSTANGEYAAAVGQSSAGGSYSFATGTASAGGKYSVALNKAGTNGGDYSLAANASLADGDYSFAAGQSYTHGAYSTALGYSQTTGDYSLSGGYLSGAYGNNSIALGTFVSASATNAVIIGSGLANNQQFTNKIANSLMIGFNSVELPSVFVGPSKNEKAKFGFVGIGTTTPKYELSVNGTVVAKTAVLVENLPGEWPDYVFDKEYSLMPLNEVEEFIANNHHLPGVPSQKEVEKNGLNLGEMEMIMMRKLEELTLHMIELEKENKKLRRQVDKLQNRKNDAK